MTGFYSRSSVYRDEGESERLPALVLSLFLALSVLINAVSTQERSKLLR